MHYLRISAFPIAPVPAGELAQALAQPPPGGRAQQGAAATAPDHHRWHYPSGGTSGAMALSRVHPNTCSSSTNWRWKKVIIGGRPAPQVTARAKRAPFAGLRSRDPRQPITLQLQYLGGSEATWVVTARGRTWRAAGHLALHDVMATVNRTLS